MLAQCICADPPPRSVARKDQWKNAVRHGNSGGDRLVGYVVSQSDDRAHVHWLAAVLKSTGSAFEGFVRDEYTTLVEVSERVLSTSVDLEYRFAPVSIPIPTDPKLLDFGTPQNAPGSVWDALGVAERARTATLDLFATDESASVQVRGCAMQ